MKFTSSWLLQVLAEEAHPLENLDRAAAQEALSKAQSEFNSAGNEKVSRYASHKLNVFSLMCQIGKKLLFQSSESEWIWLK